MAGKPLELDTEVLLPEQVVPDAYTGRWWVAHTKSRNEKALARDLSRHGITNYLPLRRKITRSPRTGRRTVSTVPVFTGYLFFTGNEQQRYQVLATNRVAKTLFVPNQPQLVTQLRHIHQVLTSNMEFEHLMGVRVGRWVRVVAGALAGVEGCVVQKLGKTRLAVSVDFLGQSVLVEVDAELLEPIDGPTSPEAGRASPMHRR